MSHIHATFTMKACILLLVLAGAGGVALLATTRRLQIARVVTAITIVGISAWWLRIDKPIEGTVLKSLSKRHGLTVADLVVFPCLAVAAGLMWVARRDHAKRVAPTLAGDTREI